MLGLSYGHFDSQSDALAVELSRISSSAVLT